MRILVVDDDFLLLRGLRRLLQDDYELEIASDSESALAIAKDFDPHVVFVDYMLGYENGVDLIRQMRGPLPDAALILMTSCACLQRTGSPMPGCTACHLSAEAIDAGADGFLAKEEMALIRVLLDRLARAA